MARLIPDTALTSSEITPGEKRATRALYQHLDDTAIIWYQPKLPQSRRPDIIVYLPCVGLILYEVKDWRISSIHKVNPDFWEIRFGEEVKSETNPFKRVRNYYFDLNAKLIKEPSLIQQDPRWKGKIKFPIATAVIFPNITKDDYISARYQEVLENEYILFKDEISSIGRDLTGMALQKRLKAHFHPWWFNDELSEEELNKLRGILYPELTSKQKEKGGKEKYIILDEHQEQVAKKIGRGHKIIRGIAGSGKSLVLCAKARLLLEEHPDWKILFTCYNISLASQLRYYLKSFASATGQGQNETAHILDQRIHVIHFHGLCSQIFKRIRSRWPKTNEK